jgi:VanZ family protein
MARMRPGLALGRHVPPVLWMATIAVFSSGSFGADRTGGFTLFLLAHLLPGASPDFLHGLHGLIRKMGHVVEYGILAALWLRALTPGRPPGRAALWAVILATGYAAVDEVRQAFAPNRSPSVADVLLDGAAAWLAVACLQGPGPVAARAAGLARVGLAALAVGSLGAAAFDLALGRAAWDLGLAALGLAAGAWVLGRFSRTWRGAP